MDCGLGAGTEGWAAGDGSLVPLLYRIALEVLQRDQATLLSHVLSELLAQHAAVQHVRALTEPAAG